MVPIIAILAALSVNPEAEAARLDLAQFPVHEQCNYAYLTTSTVPLDKRDKLAQDIAFVVASLSPETYLPDQLPVPVTIRRTTPSGQAVVEKTNLLRLDLVGLGWGGIYAKEIIKHYPYRPDLTRYGTHPLVVDGLWFATASMDPEQTGDMQYQLLYRGKPPKTRDEFFAFWGVQNQVRLNFGMIAEESPVSVEGIRRMESRASAQRGYGWITFDSRKIAGKSDPLENPARPNEVKHDAEESIASIYKTKGRESGLLQSYFLSNAAGQRQEKAPADIVKDYLFIHGDPEITNGGKCIACHPKGINEPTVDGYRKYFESGARLAFYKKEDQREADRYYDSPVQAEILEHQKLYDNGCKLVNGLSGPENTANYVEFIKLYDAPVTLEQAARELYTTPETLKLAIADYGRLSNKATGRLAALAQGTAMTRNQWVQNFDLGRYVVELWEYEKKR